MASFKFEYGASTAFTITLTSLSSTGGPARESTAVDNSSTGARYMDALVRCFVTLSSSGSPSGDKAIYVYAYGSEDGTNYTNPCTGSDANVTLPVPTDLKLIGTISTTATSSFGYQGGPFPVAPYFGYAMPRKWGVVVSNAAGLNLTASTSQYEVTYTGVYFVST